MPDLFEPFTWGPVELANRVAMAPMTRLRCESQVADELLAEYYAQRATAGLIITEGTFISPAARGFAAVPGIWKRSQADGWSIVVDAVHAKGGRIIAQLWHVGRMSHPALQPGGLPPMGPSDIPSTRGRCYVFDSTGTPRFTEPSQEVRPMTVEDIHTVIDDFASAAALAMQAGFDGVEIHAANGYLLEQFLNPGVNVRDDEWGGPDIADRVRLPLAVVDAVIDAVAARGGGARQVGIRLSPYGTAGDMPVHAEVEATALHLAEQLQARRVGHVHFADQSTTSAKRDIPAIPDDLLRRFRELYRGMVIVTGGQDRDSAQRLLDEGLADVVGFGRPYIANPHLVRRLREGLPLAEAREDLIYAQGPEGYVDYPEYADPAE
ncbi:alkene reductase [Corynebacterium sp. 335C]